MSFLIFFDRQTTFTIQFINIIDTSMAMFCIYKPMIVYLKIIHTMIKQKRCARRFNSF